MYDQIVAKLETIFRDVLDDDSINIHRSTTANHIDGWDSLSHIRIILTVEKKFKIKFSAKEVNALKNVGEFVDLISSKIV